MKKQDTYDLANKFVDDYLSLPKGQLSLAFNELPETSANEFLSGIIDHGIGVHNADLLDEERHIIEKRLSEKEINIIFSTSTLAAGVNFPLGAAIFSSWARWNQEKRAYVPIETSEFHNMAGRTGRMGLGHDAGRIIFFAKNHQEIQAANKYLQLGVLPSITPRISKKHFNRLSLQLVASGLCSTRESLVTLVCSTFSGLREQDSNLSSFEQWPAHIHSSIDFLSRFGLVTEASNGQISPTPVGKAIGYSGLLPETGIFLLDYVATKAQTLTECLPTIATSGDVDKLSFLIFSACFSSPEFRPQGGVQATRFLPWPLRNERIFNADIYAIDLVEPCWYADLMPINAAKISTDWISGAPIKSLETRVGNLSAGMLNEMFRNLVWVLQGLSSILAAASDSRIPYPCRPASVQIDDENLSLLRKLPRVLKRLGYRVAEGLPDNVLWITSLNPLNGEFRIYRHEILSLLNQGYTSPEQLVMGSQEADQVRLQVFNKVKPSPHKKANWLRDTCRHWKAQQRKTFSRRHIEKSKKLGLNKFFESYYSSIGDAFELAFEALLQAIGIEFKKIDDRTKVGAPDYCLELSGCPAIVVELKSKQGVGLVDYNKAVEVLAAAEIHGYRENFCVTICHPGVDPSVPSVIVSSGRLCVVESHDLGEALLRIAQGGLSQGRLWEWLTTPGQALIDDLAFKEYTL